jgi:hypothetical protein
MKITNKRVAVFRDVAAAYLKNSSKKTKVYHAAAKLIKSTTKVAEDYADDQTDKRVTLASTEEKDKKKVLIVENDQYVYSPENRIQLQKELRKLANTEVEIKPHFVDVKEIDEDLSIEYAGADGNTYTLSDYEVRSAFEGFIIKEEDENE